MNNPPIQSVPPTLGVLGARRLIRDRPDWYGVPGIRVAEFISIHSILSGYLTSFVPFGSGLTSHLPDGYAKPILSLLIKNARLHLGFSEHQDFK